MATKTQIKFAYEMTASPGFAHQSASLELATLLHLFARERGVETVFKAPFDVVLGGPGSNQKNETLESPLLPGLRIPLKEVF